MVIATGMVLGLAVLYVLDVWLLGTAAAWLQAFPVWLKGFNYSATEAQKEAAKHAFDGVTWYWRHPLVAAWAWLTKPAAQLANPGVRTIWLGLNILILIAGALGYGVWRIRNGCFNIPGFKLKSPHHF